MSKYLAETDCSSESLKWTKKLEEAPVHLNDKEALEKLQDDIIKNNDAASAFFFAAKFTYKVYRMQKVILDNKDAKYAFLFAQNIKNCDIKALQNIVIESNSSKYICKFACFVEGANRKLLENIIINSKDVKSAHTLLKYVPSANVKKFKDIIINYGKPRYLFELAKHLKNINDIAMIEDLIIAAKSFTYMRLFAEKIKQANVEKLEQAVLDSGNVKEIEKFAKYVRGSKMKRFLLVL